MLYLAQVVKLSSVDDLQLSTLAYQESENYWIKSHKTLAFQPAESFPEGLLVLVNVGENNEILELKNAKEWVVGLVEKYLNNTIIDQNFLDQEKNILETWRQELTSQNQDLTRMRLEIESRREQLQELEATLSAESDSNKEN